MKYPSGLTAEFRHPVSSEEEEEEDEQEDEEGT